MQFTPQQTAALKEKRASGEWDDNHPAFKRTMQIRHQDDPILFAQNFLDDHLHNAKTNSKTISPFFHKEIMAAYLTHDRVAIVAPRGHAKSTVTCLFYVLHAALYGYKRNIVLISASEDMAKRFLRTVRDELEFNVKIRHFFGEMKTDKWSETEIKLRNGCTLHAKGRGAQLRGLKDGAIRPDLIVCDDLEDGELVRSEVQRRNLEDWFNSAVLPSLEPNVGQCIVVGTILHMDSLMNRLLDPELYPDFYRRKYAAINGRNEPLWPDRFSLEKLEAFKQSYIARHLLSRFFMEYMSDPVPEEDATFRADYFQFFEGEAAPDGESLTEVYVDLGGGSTRKAADPTAMVVLTIDRSNTIFVDDYVNDRMGTDTKRMCDEIFRLHATYQPRRFVIEKTQAANLLKATLEQEMKNRRVYLNVEYISPTRGSGGGRGNMSDGKYQRIAAMEAAFKMGVIKMRKWMTEIQEQLIMFPRGKHDDLIDALAYGYQHLHRRRVKKRKPKQQTNDPLFPFEKGFKQNREGIYVPLYPEIGL